MACSLIFHRGHFGSVRMGFWIPKDKYVAIKSVVLANTKVCYAGRELLPAGTMSASPPWTPACRTSHAPVLFPLLALPFSQQDYVDNESEILMDAGRTKAPGIVHGYGIINRSKHTIMGTCNLPSASRTLHHPHGIHLHACPAPYPQSWSCLPVAPCSTA